MAAIHTWFSFPFFEAENLKTFLIILATLVRLKTAPHTAVGFESFFSRILLGSNPLVISSFAQMRLQQARAKPGIPAKPVTPAKTINTKHRP